MLGRRKYPLDCSHISTVLQNPTDSWVLSIKGLFSRCFDLLTSGFASASRRGSRRKIKGLSFCNTVVIEENFCSTKGERNRFLAPMLAVLAQLGNRHLPDVADADFPHTLRKSRFRRSRLVGRCVSITSLSEYGYHGGCRYSSNAVRFMRQG
jgi:hypothetical protein